MRTTLARILGATLVPMLMLWGLAADAATITVTSAADSGTGSLRAAITTANATTAADAIEFNIPGACPRVLPLSTPLPTITEDLTILGYTQPGSALNTLAVGSNASICLAIVAQAAELNHAISVDGPASIAVSVRGLAFGSALGSGQLHRGIQFLGGSGHSVMGNAFGGIGPGVLGDIGYIDSGVLMFSETGTVQIGGSSPSARNVFGGTSSTGIYLTGSATLATIRNNYFGLSANGVSARELPFATGIQFNASGDGSQVIGNVFASLQNGVELSNVGAVSLRGNLFGVSATGFLGAQFANYLGISLSNGAHDNVIGDLIGSSQDNVITNSTTAGVYLAATAGSGNVIRPNIVLGNALGQGELGIDIAPPGQNPNDPLDADSGPNDGQNWPELLDSKFKASNGMRTISGILSSTPGRDFRLDVYRAATCLPGGRAEAALLLGTATVSTGNSGFLNGIASFSLDLPNTDAPAFVTAMVTDLTTNSSSELSPCLVETLFRDSFE